MLAISARRIGLILVGWATFTLVPSACAEESSPLENILVAVQAADVNVDGRSQRLQIGDFLRIERSEGSRVRVSNLDRNWAGSIESSAAVRASEAVEFFSKKVTANPKDADSLAIRGRLHDALGEMESATLDLDQAVKLGSDEGRLYRGLHRLKRQQVDDALADFGGLISAGKLMSRALIFRAQVYFAQALRKKDGALLQQALSDLDQAVKFEDVKVAAYLARANIRAITKDFKNAVADYTEAIGLGANQAYANRAASLMALRRFEEAVQDLGNAIQLISDQSDKTEPRVAARLAQILTTRARAYQAKGDVDAAHDDLEEALKLAPDQPYILRTRGMLHFAQQKYELAIADLLTAVQASPDDGEARLALARSYELARKLKESLEQYEQASQLMPRDPRPLLGLASVRLSNEPTMRDAEKAVAHSRQACELTDWKLASAVKALLAAHTAAGQMDTAVNLFEQHQAVFDAQARQQIQGELQKLKSR